MPQRANPVNLVTVSVTLISMNKNPLKPPKIEHRFLKVDNPTLDVLDGLLQLDSAILTVSDPTFVYSLVSENAYLSHLMAFRFSVDSGLIPEDTAFDLVDSVEIMLPKLAANDANHLFASKWFEAARKFLDSEPVDLSSWLRESGYTTRKLVPSEGDLDRLKNSAYAVADTEQFYARRIAALETLAAVRKPTEHEGKEQKPEALKQDERAQQLYDLLIAAVRDGTVNLEFWMEANNIEAGNLDPLLVDVLSLVPAIYGNEGFYPDVLPEKDSVLVAKLRKWAKEEIAALNEAYKADLDELRAAELSGKASSRLLKDAETGAEIPCAAGRYVAGKRWWAHYIGTGTTLDFEELTVGFSLVF